MYDENAVEQYQKVPVDSLNTWSMEEDINASGNALSSVICSAPMKCFCLHEPLGRRTYRWTDACTTLYRK